MPVQRVALTDLEHAVAELEEKFRILEIGYPDEGSAVIRYEPRGKRSAPGDVETRA